MFAWATEHGNPNLVRQSAAAVRTQRAKDPRQGDGQGRCIATRFRQPIVVDEHGVIVCGHTRVMAAKQLGLKEVPVHVAAGLSPEQVRAYRLMDNRSHEEAAWDLDGLTAELLELQGLDVDLSLTGFDMSELDRLLPHSTEGEDAPHQFLSTQSPGRAICGYLANTDFSAGMQPAKHTSLGFLQARSHD